MARQVRRRFGAAGLLVDPDTGATEHLFASGDLRTVSRVLSKF